MKSFLVYKCTCVSCNSSYIGKNVCHFKTRIEEHIKKDNKFHIFKHLHSTTTCFDSYNNSFCFKMIDKANYSFCPPLVFSVFVFFCFVFFAFVFHLLSSSSLTLIIGTFYCLNYTSLLFHLITMHLALLFFSFICCFHYLYANYRHILLS